MRESSRSRSPANAALRTETVGEVPFDQHCGGEEAVRGRSATVVRSEHLASVDVAGVDVAGVHVAGTGAAGVDVVRRPAIDRRRVHLTLLERGRRRRVQWCDVGALDFSDFGLVLGAGGATGAAFEAGIMLALAIDHDVEPRQAGCIVGTSAGSLGAALVALGFEAADVAAVVSESYEHVSPAMATHGVRFAGDVPPVPSVLSMFRPPTPARAAATFVKVLRRDFTASVLQMMRTGTYEFGANIDFLHKAEWPAGPPMIRICAAELATGHRVAFDESSDVPLAAAVAASCAVPGVMRPVRVSGKLFVDGGIVSPTNADLLAGAQGPELVVIVSPMSGREARTVSGLTSARFAARRLAGELSRFHREQRVLIIEPAATLSQLVNDDALSPVRSKQILTTAFVSASA